MEPALFVAELRARLGIHDQDTWCPRCDGILDPHGYHASLCVAGGERSQRHHAVRDLVFCWAEKGGLRPEREKAGLLLPQSPDDTTNNGRRPADADVYLPGSLPHLTLPSRLHSGKRPWHKSATKWQRLPRPTPVTSSSKWSDTEVICTF